MKYFLRDRVEQGVPMTHGHLYRFDGDEVFVQSGLAPKAHDQKKIFTKRKLPDRITKPDGRSILAGLYGNRQVPQLRRNNVERVGMCGDIPFFCVTTLGRREETADNPILEIETVSLNFSHEF